MKRIPVIFFSLLLLVANYSMAEIESSSTLTIKAWEGLSMGDFEKTHFYADKCIELYKDEATNQQSSLKKFPDGEEIKKYEALNNVGACLFIKGEAFFQQARYEEARPYYQAVIDNYGFAQYWDPKGWYWKVAEKSKAVLDKIEAMSKPDLKKEVEEISLVEGLNFPLFDEGTEDIVDYAKYGRFEGVGTTDYRYVIKDRKRLAKAVGEGIFPNNTVYRDPIYKSYMEKRLLEGSHWDYVNSDSLQANFYKWATAGEDPGVKLYYAAYALERAMLYKHAVKTYYAIVVHYPRTVSWTYWDTPWYVGRVAIDKIRYLTRKHPELGMKLEGADIIVENGFDFDVKNDIITVSPGHIVSCSPEELKTIRPIDLSKLKIIKTIGGPKVELVRYENGHWQLKMDKRPIIVKAVAYTPTVVGQSPDKGTLKDWSFEDYNKNGKIDGPYDSWVDKDLNNLKDKDEEVIGDFKLLKEMGANAIRVYHYDYNQNKELFRKAYQDYGLMVIMGDFLGAYATGSGASWHEGTDYSNPIHQQNMKDSVRRMVEEYKDEPYILIWVLGNETNYGVANNAKETPASYYKFANEVARMIKALDPTRPVAICNGDTLFLDIFARCAPDVDIYGTNSYRGQQGFGIGLWHSVKRLCDRPVLITEYGCPAYQKGKPQKIAEIGQAEYHQGSWEDILYNSAGYGVGNSIGGVVFEWLDEWWKAYEPGIHDTEGLYTGPFPGGWVYEEWFGIVGQGDGSKSPYLRQLRESYFLYKKMWNE